MWAMLWMRSQTSLEIQWRSAGSATSTHPFRVRPYRRAATIIEGLADNIETLAVNGTLRNVPGIGEDLANKIDEYIRTGKIEFHENLKQEIPLGLAKMVEIPSVGPKTAK